MAIQDLRGESQPEMEEKVDFPRGIEYMVH